MWCYNMIMYKIWIPQGQPPAVPCALRNNMLKVGKTLQALWTLSPKALRENRLLVPVLFWENVCIELNQTTSSVHIESALL